MITSAFKRTIGSTASMKIEGSIRSIFMASNLQEQPNVHDRISRIISLQAHTTLEMATMSPSKALSTPTKARF